MIFADEIFYKDIYLAGRTEIIPFAEFNHWARRASDRINWRKIELSDIPEQLKMCTCEVAEALYVDSEKKFMSMEPSQSVGAYSKGAVNVRQEKGELTTEINGIINDHLANTELHNKFVFRGM